MTEFTEFTDEAEQLKTTFSGRNALWDDMEAMYFVEPKDREQIERMGDNVKLTFSSDPRDQLNGAVRLMIATDPKPKVPSDIEGHDDIEEFAKAMWGGSGQVTGVPAHFDPILSGLLYGESHMGVVSLRKLAERAQGKVHQKLAEQAAAITPMLFETWSPRGCYAEHGRLGLTQHYRELEMTARQVRYNWGVAADAILGVRGNKDVITYCEKWDPNMHGVWIRGIKKPILFEDHGLSTIPIVHTITEGSLSLFSDRAKQLQPFLYSVSKSGFWSRQNLALTVLYTMIFAIGGNAMFKYTANQEGKKIEVDWTKPGGVITLGQGENFESLLKQVIDPSVIQGLNIANEKIIDMTMYKQALGAPLGGDQPYSTVALLSQSGRLPLVSPQKRLGWMIARAMWTAFQLMKEEGEGGERIARYGKRMTFDPKMIPDDLDIQVELDINLPQDQLSLASIANLLVQSGIVSKEWIRGEILNISNDSKMSRAIIGERLGESLYRMLEQQLVAGEMQQQQAPTDPGLSAPPRWNTSDTGEQPPEGGPGMPPELLAGGMQGPESLEGLM